MTKSPAGRGQTGCLPCPDRKSGLQRRTVQQIVDPVPLLPTLDDPAPQMVEQLVEVPTIVSWSLLQLIMEQNADIPFPGRGGRIAGLQGSLPGQSATALHGSWERFSERIVEQNVDFSVGGGLQDFRPGQSSSSSSHVPARVSEALDEPGEGFFRTFPNIKKSAEWGSSRAGSSCGLLGRRRRRLDPHRLRARAILEEVVVRTLAVVPAVGRAVTAARWLRGYGCGSLSGC